MRKGLAFGIASYLWWGVVPIYFKAVAQVPAMEVLAHRIVWAVVLLALLIWYFGRWSDVRAALRKRRVLFTLFGTTALIAINWYTFIWSVSNDKLLDASLGYFINPLINVLLGVVFLNERLRRWQLVSIGVAAIGVGYLTWTLGRLPTITLVLAFSFAFYGLLRKTAKVDSLVGLTLEVTLLLPFAVGYLFVLSSRDELRFMSISWQIDVLLCLGGVITAVPLLCFASAARLLRYSTMGFLQYIAPSMQFLLAVLLFGEPVTRTHLISFAFIWASLGLFTWDALRSSRSTRLEASQPFIKALR